MVPEGSYCDFLFLSPTILLFPNRINNTLDFWDVQSNSPFPIAILGLPALNEGYYVDRTSCKCAPNPTSAAGLTHSTKPFHASSSDAIVTFCFQMNENPVIINRGTSYLMMFVHRWKLLEISSNCRIAESSRSQDFEAVPWETWGPDVTRWAGLQ